uniref:Uncharacterized protein n=1 Tax=Anguilla anguilla TaxID=7936 RepID=A0A0E9PTN6_ANGAN
MSIRQKQCWPSSAQLQQHNRSSFWECTFTVTSISGTEDLKVSLTYPHPGN